ncbi:transporter [Limnoglobus roseus]|uniref:Uncharacterized protein n=1 Tax=Limnoglobus roseus TaxID=2598579 RepID=A0A5C1A5F4_9BACT|nr:transporter [Limnoglobus roseus]QEL13555.1 hypothetical protein PX52LOC_00413 [Limnoglobus roseus]
MRRALRQCVCALALCASPLAAADPPRLLEAPVSLGSARAVDLPSEPASGTIHPAAAKEPATPEPEVVRPKPVRLSKPANARTLSDDEVIRLDRRLPQDDRAEPLGRYEPRHPNDDRDEIDDFVGRRSRLGQRDRDDDSKKRASAKFGDKLRDWLAPGGGRDSWLFSDHAFDQFATPLSNPFLAEDPRALTEVRPIFIYQSIPTPQPNFQGGNIYFFGTRASIAFTERISLTVNKLGAIALNPSNKAFGDSEFGFAELWLGPKFTFYRNPQSSAIASAGAIFQIPTGPGKVYQDTGNLSIVPYISAGKTLCDFGSIGSLNGIANAGYSISTNRLRSDYFYGTAHLDFDVRNNHRFYPIAELNYFQYTTDGQQRAFSGEGQDLFNFGSQSKGAGLVTGALGGRFKITEAAQIGAAYELPLFGNRDVFRYRFTLDLIFRY